MDYRNAFAISAAGMSVEKMRLDVTSLNLANMHTTKGADGKLYQPMRVVATPVTNFAQKFDSLGGAQAGLPSVRIEPMSVTPKQVYEPGHPDADERGYVTMPGVNHLTEMVNMMTALRAYEANVVAMNAAKSMAQHALELGGNS